MVSAKLHKVTKRQMVQSGTKLLFEPVKRMHAIDLPPKKESSYNVSKIGQTKEIRLVNLPV